MKQAAFSTIVPHTFSLDHCFPTFCTTLFVLWIQELCGHLCSWTMTHPWSMPQSHTTLLFFTEPFPSWQCPADHVRTPDSLTSFLMQSNTPIPCHLPMNIDRFFFRFLSNPIHTRQKRIVFKDEVVYIGQNDIFTIAITIIQIHNTYLTLFFFFLLSWTEFLPLTTYFCFLVFLKERV